MHTVTESSLCNCDNRSFTPETPDSVNSLLGAAGFVAYDRRVNQHQQTKNNHKQPILSQPLKQQQSQNKSIMNCFHDRSSSYPRSQNTVQTVVQYKQQKTNTSNGDSDGRPDAVVFLRELRTRPNKLTLLKSSSTRDLSRLILDGESVPSNTVLVSNSSLEMLNTVITCNSSSSDALPTSGSPAQEQRCNNLVNVCHNPQCYNRWKDIQKRLHTLEQDLLIQSSYTKELETKLHDLAKQLSELTNNEKRKKSASMPKKSTNSAVNTVHSSKLVAWMNLTNWWKSRPSIETLKQQNIYNDEPCFDTEIELVLKHDKHKTVPRIVVDCCDLIDELYRRSAQPIEGIYRQCGDYNKIQTLRFSIDSNDYESLRQPNIDIHTLSGVLKLFLREIKSPLVSINEAKLFIGKANQWLLKDLTIKIDILRRLIRSLPEINHDTMDYLFAHFNRLTKVPLHHISAEAVSISITPSIFHSVSKGVHVQDFQELLRESEILADCVKIMIEYHQRIFE